MRKFFCSLGLALLSLPSFAQDIFLNEYNYTVPDIARRGITKEQIFNGLERNFIKLGDSICSNRALIWAFDMKRHWGVDSAKIFLFYTEKRGEVSDKTWWYHVAPLVNENGTLWVVDAGFPRFVPRPLLPQQWLKKFAASENCKELKAGDDDLIAQIFDRQQFPSRTRHGVYDCYYRIASAPYWTPSAIARNFLGRERNGAPVDFVRERINTGELMQACMEASTTAFGGLFVNKRRKCQGYLGLE